MTLLTKRQCGRLAGLLMACVILSPWSHALADDSNKRFWVKNIHTGEEMKLLRMTQTGRLSLRSLGHATRLFRSWRTEKRRPVNPRLLRTLMGLQQHFDGRRIDLVSGYRVPEEGESPTSYHHVSRAADLAIDGVENRAIYDWCRKQPRLGCGLYPHGRHVHIDVRGERGLWVDLSPYGEHAEFVRHPAQWLRQHPNAGREKEE